MTWSGAKPVVGAVISVNPEFTVIDESEDWIVVSKPAPLIVHPSGKKHEPTLLCGLKALLLYEMVNGAQLSILNRLDRETSGLVVVSKNKSTARKFGRAMERREIQKQYHALVRGRPEWKEITVDAPILRKGEVLESPIWVKQTVHPAGKSCVTHFRVMNTFEIKGETISKLEITPQTGRMHQIRVHAAYLGYPIVGDKIYGFSEQCYLDFIVDGWTEDLAKKLWLPRHALHASAMTIENGEQRWNWQCSLSGDLVNFIGKGCGECSENEQV